MSDEKIKSDYAGLLNDLCDMQDSPYYSLRQSVLIEAENAIVTLEKKVKELSKPTMTVERAREILEGNEYFTNDKGGFHLPINQYKSHIRMESDMYTADELEAIAFLMRNP